MEFKKLVGITVFLLLVPIIFGYDLSAYPQIFAVDKKLNVVFVVGATSDESDILAITSITEQLRKDYEGFVFDPSPCPEGYICTHHWSEGIKIDIDVNNISDKNIVSIGGPCANKITAQIMDLPTTWPECTTGFEEGKGIIKLYNKWNKTQLVVAGYSAEDTRRAAEILADYKKHNLIDKEFIVIDEKH